MPAPPYPSDHNAGHQLAIGRNKIILTGRFCQSLKLSPNKAYQLHSAVLDSHSSPPLDALHFNLVFTNIVKLTNAYENLFILSTPREKTVRCSSKKKVQCQAIQQRKKMYSIHPTQTLSRTISSPDLTSRDQSFAVNLFPSNPFKAPPSHIPPYINPSPPLPSHPLPSSSSTHSQIPNKNKNKTHTRYPTFQKKNMFSNNTPTEQFQLSKMIYSTKQPIGAACVLQGKIYSTKQPIGAACVLQGKVYSTKQPIGAACEVM